MATGTYSSLPDDFYEASLRSANPITRYYHGKRYEKVRRHLTERFKKGMRILDIGGGSSDWNLKQLPITAIDLNRKMLDYGRKKGRIGRKVVWDLRKTPLPFRNESFDFAILSEVLEHLDHPQAILKETKRILSKNGFLIITVPLDAPFSLWSFLFGLECIVLGDVLGNEYYKKRCGHVQHFSIGDLSNMLEKTGFSIEKKDLGVLNTCIVARKPNQGLTLPDGMEMLKGNIK